MEGATPEIDEAENYFFERLQEQILKSPKNNVYLPKLLTKICGVDAAYSYNDNCVVAVAVSISKGNISENSIYRGRFTFPYVSGLFFLHEGPFVTAAVRRLTTLPELICFDAHGTAHPRLAGLAMICGKMLGIPSIGIAKRPLFGQIEPYREGLSRINFKGKILGLVTFNPRRYWSPGYSVSNNRLEEIISKYGNLCLTSLAEAHRISKGLVSKQR